MDRNNQPQIKEFDERIIALDRVTRVVKGGRRFRFRATVVVGDGKGRVGIGVGKGRDTQTSIAKAVHAAKRSMVNVVLDGATIPHDVQVSFGGATVLLKPARPGTGVIAGGAVRNVVESVGIHDVLTKALGSSNKINNAYATVAALDSLTADETKKTSSKMSETKAVAKKPAPKKTAVKTKTSAGEKS